MSDQQIQELKDQILEARTQLVVAVLRRDANLQEKGELERLGEDFDEIDSLWPRGSREFRIPWNFYDEWIYARDHNFMTPLELSKNEWPKYARQIADHLATGTEITDRKILASFDIQQRGSCLSALKGLFRQDKRVGT